MPHPHRRTLGPKIVAKTYYRDAGGDMHCPKHTPSEYKTAHIKHVLKHYNDESMCRECVYGRRRLP